MLEQNSTTQSQFELADVLRFHSLYSLEMRPPPQQTAWANDVPQVVPAQSAYVIGQALGHDL